MDKANLRTNEVSQVDNNKLEAARSLLEGSYHLSCSRTSVEPKLATESTTSSQMVEDYALRKDMLGQNTNKGVDENVTLVKDPKDKASMLIRESNGDLFSRLKITKLGPNNIEATSQHVSADFSGPTGQYKATYNFTRDGKSFDLKERVNYVSLERMTPIEIGNVEYHGKLERR